MQAGGIKDDDSVSSQPVPGLSADDLGVGRNFFMRCLTTRASCRSSELEKVRLFSTAPAP
jgi:hypothetical protein